MQQAKLTYSTEKRSLSPQRAAGRGHWLEGAPATQDGAAGATHSHLQHRGMPEVESRQLDAEVFSIGQAQSGTLHSGAEVLGLKGKEKWDPPCFTFRKLSGSCKGNGFSESRRDIVPEKGEKEHTARPYKMYAHLLQCLS